MNHEHVSGFSKHRRYKLQMSWEVNYTQALGVRRCLIIGKVDEYTRRIATNIETDNAEEVVYQRQWHNWRSKRNCHWPQSRAWDNARSPLALRHMHSPSFVKQMPSGLLRPHLQTWQRLQPRCPEDV
jgi:hypothetical protein